MFLLYVLALVGCQISEFHCETERIDIADDEADLGDLASTMEEILAGLEGVRTFPATNREGGLLTAELDVARGDGTAVFADATMVETTHLGLEVALHHNDMGIIWICDDVVEVPVIYALTTTDGSIAVEGEALAEAVATAGAEDRVSFVAPIDLETATLPEPPALADGAELGAWYAGPDLDQASLAWVGTEKEALAFPPAVGARE
ncbi:MAG: hypothetical protein V4850_15945 [Myxococcota bacterium]